MSDNIFMVSCLNIWNKTQKFEGWKLPLENETTNITITSQICKVHCLPEKDTGGGIFIYFLIIILFESKKYDSEMVNQLGK